MAKIIGKNADITISNAATEPAAPTTKDDAAYNDGAADNRTDNPAGNDAPHLSPLHGIRADPDDGKTDQGSNN